MQDLAEIARLLVAHADPEVHRIGIQLAAYVAELDRPYYQRQQRERRNEASRGAAALRYGDLKVSEQARLLIAELRRYWHGGWRADAASRVIPTQ